jgi:hypothetical protein
MNRIHLMVLSGVLSVGGLGLLAPPARAQASAGAIAAPAQVTAPRYFYGFGPSGYGYYSYPAAPTTPAYRGGFYSTPATTVVPATPPVVPRTTRLSSASRTVADPTGRDVSLYKPWLQPLR